MTEEHALFRDNRAAYALGSLDTDEVYALEVHLQTCPECQAELVHYERISTGLLSALPPQAPPPALRQRLAARLPQAGKNERVRPAWRISFAQLAVSAAFVLLLGLNLFATLQVRNLQRQQAELAQRLDTEQSAIAILAYPGTRTLPINGEGVAGSLLMNPETNTAVLYAWNLSELPGDKTYQIWLIDPQGNRVSGGLFVSQPEQIYTSASVASAVPFSDFVGLGVTIEPWGGSPGPTGPNVLRVNF